MVLNVEFCMEVSEVSVVKLLAIVSDYYLV